MSEELRWSDNTTKNMAFIAGLSYTYDGLIILGTESIETWEN